MSTNADENTELVEKECEELKAKCKDLEGKNRELQWQLQWAKKDSEERMSEAERNHEMLKKETTGDKDLKQRNCNLEGEIEAVERENEELGKKFGTLKGTVLSLLS
ncbi:hypothetical protein J4E85_001948 [Alternaria conjuncta]|uniref:uncharacterized protein n=1 Tax=Alternaria conjuncta TaxID=181017 RepID=UPI00221F75C1|nr:uncharacterized protein J4E85_001948 [Alternaria conjuncta]KAI4936614.1 hypothetical protein J4E85_001948 [Alternaria conjuncta]